MQIIIAIVVAVVVWKIIGHISRTYARKRRQEYLMSKYDDADLVEALMGRRFWQGQTSEQLIDSLGEPRDLDRKVLKSKTKETWKYNEVRKNQFSLRIFVENDLVVGWDKKA